MSPSDSALASSAPDSDVVISSRVRIARNISGFPFVSRASNAVRMELLRVTHSAVDRANATLAPTIAGNLLNWIELMEAPTHQRVLLVEKHRVSKPFAEAEGPRALALSKDEGSSVMVNEEDHLRIQAIRAGSNLTDSFDAAFALEGALGNSLDFAFHPRWGYLTACPTNVGCGIRLSAMLHLPALRFTGEIERVKRAAADLRLAVRGYYGEGSESVGDFYQLSNQVTLGATEEALRDDFLLRILPRVVAYEREARAIALERSRTVIEDRVWRAWAVLTHARLLSADDATKLLSRVRLGTVSGLLEVPLPTIQRLLLQVQPAHLLSINPDAAQNEEIERGIRATFIRETLLGK